MVVWYRDQQDITHYQGAVANFTSQALTDTDSSIPSIAVFMEKIYADSVNAVLRTIYLTQRSYQFWALRLDDPIADILSGSPFSTLNAVTIEAAGEILLED